MPKPRSQQVDISTTPYYHCISRCVRRAFLLGHDSYTGRSFDHRKQWVVDRLRQLAGIFAADVCAYALMSNHFHLVVRLAPQRAQSWTEEQVAERYGRLFRHTVEEARTLPAKAFSDQVRCWRHRLCDLSWFMRCLNESIARRANREDHCTGRFWEGRFRSQALLDEGAVLTCMSYVDLNPIRAGVATTLEDSELTSIRERLRVAASQEGSDRWLAAFVGERGDSERLPLPLEDYIEVLRWSAVAVRGTSRPAQDNVVKCLARLELDSNGFVEVLRNYARSFFTMVGHVHRIDLESRRRGYKRRPGVRGAQRLYRIAAG